MEQLWQRPRPFAFASRADDESFVQPDSFRQREQAYIAALDDYDGDRR